MPTPDSVLDCLRCVGDHLSPGGHFMIDTFNSSRQQSDPNPPERDGPGVFGTWTPQQLGDLLVNAKYRIVARYGDYDLTPHDPESPRLILKAVAG
jgi:hypothetical protein